MTVYIVYNNDNQIKPIEDAFKASSIFVFIDEQTTKGKKKGFKLKGSWGARLTPFAVVYNDEDKPVKAFYSEADNDIIKSLITYLNEQSICS